MLPSIRMFSILLGLFCCVSGPARAATLNLIESTNAILSVHLVTFGFGGSVVAGGDLNRDAEIGGTLSIESIGALGIQAAYRVAIDLIDEPLVFSSVLGLNQIPVTLQLDEYSWQIPGPGNPPIIGSTPDSGLPMNGLLDLRGVLTVGTTVAPFAYSVVELPTLIPFASVVGATLSNATLEQGRVPIVERTPLVIDGVPLVLLTELRFERVVFAPEPGATLLLGLALALVGIRRATRA